MNTMGDECNPEIYAYIKAVLGWWMMNEGRKIPVFPQRLQSHGHFHSISLTL